MLSVLARRASIAARTATRTISITAVNAKKDPSVDKVSPSAAKVFSNDDLRKFMGVFPDLVRELSYAEEYKDLPMVNKHFSKCIQHNVPTGKKNRGMSVVSTFKQLVPESQRSDKDMEKAIVLGWCVEFLQAFFLVLDDLIDGSTTRRGQPAWYLKGGSDDGAEQIYGAAAANDGVMLETAVYSLLKNHFGEEEYYPLLLEEFIATTRHTAMGQCKDILYSRLKNPDGSPKLEAFGMKQYSEIVKLKTSYYSFCLPVSLGMILSGVHDPNLHNKAKTILLEMGRFFQIQDDFLDCFGDPKVTGKEGTDIQDGKCSWLIVVAMQRASKEQKDILKSCYGRADPDAVQRVRDVYTELKLKKVFKAHEEESYKDILERIKQIPGEGKLLNPKIFHLFLDKIYKRDS